MQLYQLIFLLLLIRDEKPQNEDFVSQRALAPDKVFQGIDECVARSLSVFDNLEQAKMRLKLPKFRKCHVIGLHLVKTDGKIKKTFGAGHYSWWRSADFSFDSSMIGR